MAIDLSRLRALELPKETVEVEILGEIQHVEISAMGDDQTLDIAEMRENGESLSEVKVRAYLLECCAGMSADDAKMLCRKDGRAASRIISAILDLSGRFDRERERLREEAKKKPVTETAAPTAG